MKILIQGLGEVPIPIEVAMRKEKPDETYIICSDYQLRYVHPRYTKSNWDVLNDLARETKTKLVFKRCDVFDPKAVRDCLFDILRRVDIRNDEVIFNYTSGSAPVRLFLGVLGVQLSKYNKKSKILYTISYPEEGVEVSTDHAEKLREYLPTDIDLLLDMYVDKSPPKETKKPHRK